MWPASGIQAEISTDCTFSSIGCWTLESSSILSNRRPYVAFVSCCISEWCVLATCLWMAEWLAKIWLQQHQQVPSLWLLSSFDATKAANDCEKEIYGFLLCIEFVSTDYTMLEWVLFHTLAFAWGFLLLLYFWNIKDQPECYLSPFFYISCSASFVGQKVVSPVSTH